MLVSVRIGSLGGIEKPVRGLTQHSQQRILTCLLDYEQESGRHEKSLRYVGHEMLNPTNDLKIHKTIFCIVVLETQTHKKFVKYLSWQFKLLPLSERNEIICY